MPILTVPNENAPLSQGDILKGLRLYSTGGNWHDPQEPGGAAERAERYELSLVLSRPCVLKHKEDFLVAAVHAVREDPPADVTCFAEAEHFLEDLRDGKSRPDRFYVGWIAPLEPGRYYAHLDSIHTVRKPPSEKLQEFLRTHRVATLTPHFLRDMHVRVFAAVATLGFDDVAWLSDQDLRWLADLGKKQLSAKQAEFHEAKAVLSGKTASGAQPHGKHLENQQARVANLEREITKLQEQLSPYERELKARGS